MKNILSALLLSATLFACNNSENAKNANETAKTSTINKTEIEAKLLGMEEAWNNSNMEKDHGLKFQTEILADDFISHNNKGEVENKEAVLTSIKKGDYTVSEVKNGPMIVKIYASNFAVVVGEHQLKMKDKSGLEYSNKYYWTDTWMERGGKWQAISSGSVSVADKK
jgi:hypothetical protein